MGRSRNSHNALPGSSEDVTLTVCSGQLRGNGIVAKRSLQKFSLEWNRIPNCMSIVRGADSWMPGVDSISAVGSSPFLRSPGFAFLDVDLLVRDVCLISVSGFSVATAVSSCAFVTAASNDIAVNEIESRQ